MRDAGGRARGAPTPGTVVPALRTSPGALPVLVAQGWWGGRWRRGAASAGATAMPCLCGDGDGRPAACAGAVFTLPLLLPLPNTDY